MKQQSGNKILVYLPVERGGESLNSVIDQGPVCFLNPSTDLMIEAHHTQP
jgi:hypothetical protein